MVFYFNKHTMKKRKRAILQFHYNAI